MAQDFLKLENVKIVTKMSWDAVPSEELFREKGKTIELGNVPWDLASFCELPPDRSKCVMIRGFATLAEDGIYILRAGADWWFKVHVDSVPMMDSTGGLPLTAGKAGIMLNLKAGKHTVDIHFSRGIASAHLALTLEYCGRELPPAADFNETTGKIRKELHGANTAPILSSRNLTNYDEAIRRLNFTWARTHDWPLWNAGQRIIDTHFIFPLMKLDPKDPSNYFFDATDEIIRLAQEEAGLKIFYRLGTSIEHTAGIHFNAVPPTDYEKYAEILAGIVRHYTRGWANGFHYDIPVWEIWNEPEGYTTMWTAPYDTTFVPFFVTVLKRLKSEFPELEFGGPAMCTLNEALFSKLLNACKEAGVAPDFISWHRYSCNMHEMIAMPEDGRRMLDDMGFKNTKTCINEWHYHEDWDNIRSSDPETYRKAVMEGPTCMQGIDSGVFNLAVLAAWQDTPLDYAMWYGAGWDSPNYGYRNVFREYTKNYYSMEMFGRFLRDYTVKCKSANVCGYTLAGQSEDGKKAGLLIADYRGPHSELSARVNGLKNYTKISAIVLDETRNNEPCPVEVQGENLILKKVKPGSAAFLVMLEK